MECAEHSSRIWDGICDQIVQNLEGEPAIQARLASFAEKTWRKEKYQTPTAEYREHQKLCSISKTKLPWLGNLEQESKRTSAEETATVQIIHLEGDLMAVATKSFIAHQCNCTGTRAQGLAWQACQRFPVANTYAKTDREPGTVSGHGNVVNMYAQVHPGGHSLVIEERKPADKKHVELDSEENRRIWFQKCLSQIREVLRAKGGRDAAIAFPEGIGCGLARGSWEIYHQMIDKFAKENPDWKVMIVVRKTDMTGEENQKPPDRKPRRRKKKINRKMLPQNIPLLI